MEQLNGARVLVTGGAGFIGSHVVRKLVAAGAETHVLTKAVSSTLPPRLVDLRDQIVLEEGNLTDRRAMDAAVERARPEYVLHLGAYTHVGKSWYRVDECVQANVQGTVNLLQALDGTGYKRFVYTGTSEIYGDIAVPFTETNQVHPISPYAVSKYAGERFCQMFQQGHDWPIVMVRPFNAFGPGQTVDRIIPEIIVRALRGEELQMTEGRQTREFNFVEDLADGFLAAAVAPNVEGMVINLGCGQDVSMKDLATKILDIMGNPITPQFGALEYRPTEIWEMYCSNERAREHLGWTPTHTLEEGLAKTIAWYTQELENPNSSFVT